MNHQLWQFCFFLVLRAWCCALDRRSLDQTWLRGCSGGTGRKTAVCSGVSSLLITPWGLRTYFFPRTFLRLLPACSCLLFLQTILTMLGKGFVELNFFFPAQSTHHQTLHNVRATLLRLLWLRVFSFKRYCFFERWRVEMSFSLRKFVITNGILERIKDRRVARAIRAVHPFQIANLRIANDNMNAVRI